MASLTTGPESAKASRVNRKTSKRTVTHPDGTRTVTTTVITNTPGREPLKEVTVEDLPSLPITRRKKVKLEDGTVAWEKSITIVHHDGHRDVTIEHEPCQFSMSDDLEPVNASPASYPFPGEEDNDELPPPPAPIIVTETKPVSSRISQWENVAKDPDACENHLTQEPSPPKKNATQQAAELIADAHKSSGYEPSANKRPSDMVSAESATPGKDKDESVDDAPQSNADIGLEVKKDRSVEVVCCTIS